MHDFLRELKTRETLFMVVIAVIVGILAGYGAVGFRKLIVIVKAGGFEYLLPFLEKHALGAWALVLIPTLGGLLVGPFTALFPEEAKGHGVPEVMEAIMAKRGSIKPRTVLLRAMASALSIGSGGSVGREGPIVQIGSAIGSTMGQIFRLKGNPVKILVGCGAAGGIAATFNAPIAGFLFANEVILGDFSLSTVSPIILASVASTAVSRHYLGTHPAFIVPSYELISPVELVFYALLGVIVSLVALVYVRSLYWAEDFFDKKVAIPAFLKPALGGLLLGIIALHFPHVMGNGYPPIEQAMNGKMALGLMVHLTGVKIVATSITIRSGGSAGVFAPALFVVAMTGGTFGTLIHSFFPTVTAPVGCYALVGMGGLFAAAAFAPLTAILILFELTNNYTVILPIMIVCVIGYVHSRWIRKYSIYTLKLHRKGLEVERGRSVNILKDVKVKDAMVEDFVTVPWNTPLYQLAKIIHGTGQSYYPVLDNQKNLAGIITFHDLEPALFVPGLEHLLVAYDLASRKLIVTDPEETLYDAVKKMDKAGIRQLPVTDPARPEKLKGFITRKDIVAAYNREMVSRGVS